MNYSSLEGNPLLQRDEPSEAALVCDLGEDRLRIKKEESLLDSIGGQTETPPDIDYDDTSDGTSAGKRLENQRPV